MYEIYLVAQGTSVLRVEQRTVSLSAGDVLFLEPGDAHTSLDGSTDYLHFVIHAPGLFGEEARAVKAAVSRRRLGMTKQK